MPKPNAYWYATNWRVLAPNDAGSMPSPPTPVARIVDLLDALSPAGGSVTVNAIASTATAELLVDGVSHGSKPALGAALAWTVPVLNANAGAQCAWPLNLSGVQCKGLAVLPAGAASSAACEAAACAAGAVVWQWSLTPGCWVGSPPSLPCPPPRNTSNVWVGGGRSAPPPFRNNATLVARDAGGAVVARHTVLSPSPAGAAGLVFAVDVPSPATGTGSRLLLDGADIALLRITVVDARGALVSTAPVNVTFSIVSGPGRIAGVGSGDPTSHEQPNGATVATFGGLARVFVVVTLDCTSDNRARMLVIDRDGTAGPTRVVPPGIYCPTDDIVVEASAPGLPTVQASVPVSENSVIDSVDAVARASVAISASKYLDSFLG